MSGLSLKHTGCEQIVKMAHVLSGQMGEGSASLLLVMPDSCLYYQLAVLVLLYTTPLQKRERCEMPTVCPSASQCNCRIFTDIATVCII